MILASDIFTSIRSLLDDDNSGRYEVSDLATAVNMAVGYLVQIFSVGFEQRKFAPESLRELIKVKVLPVVGTGTTKRVNVSSITESNLLTIFGVEPSPEMGHLGTTTTLEPEEFIGSKNKWASRLTLEEWSEKSEDPFSEGSTVLIPSFFVRSSYLGPGKYFSDGDDYMFIRPSTVFEAGNENVAIYYLTKPIPVVDGADYVELPFSLYNIIVEKALNYISLQQDPNSKLGPATKQEIDQILSLLV